MRRFRPAELVTLYPKRVAKGVAHDQAFATLTLTAVYATWTVANRIVAEYMPLTVPGNFAIISWPTTVLPMFVRANGTRYALNKNFDSAPVCWSEPYRGQTLNSEAVFEYWSSAPIPGGQDVPDTVIRISKRKQLTYVDVDGDAYIATPYANYGRPYPVYLPIEMTLP